MEAEELVNAMKMDPHLNNFGEATVLYMASLVGMGQCLADNLLEYKLGQMFAGIGLIAAVGITTNRNS